MRESRVGQNTWASKMKRTRSWESLQEGDAEAGGTGERKLEGEPQKKKILCLKMPL